MSSTSHGTTPYYYVPNASRHPVMAAIGLFFVILGAGQWINGEEWGKYSLFAGLKAKAACTVAKLICRSVGA
jgi:cytochrome c oxidase subunit 3